MCTKVLPELSCTATLLEPFLAPFNTPSSSSEGPVLVLLQNGIGIEKPIRDVYPHVSILSAVPWLGANFLLDGRVEHGNLEKLDLGIYTTERRSKEEKRVEYAGSERGKLEQTKLEEFAQLLRMGGSDVAVKEEIQIARWHKNIWYVVLCSFPWSL